MKKILVVFAFLVATVAAHAGVSVIRATLPSGISWVGTALNVTGNINATGSVLAGTTLVADGQGIFNEGLAVADGASTFAGQVTISSSTLVDASLTVDGNVTLSSNSVVDAYTDSFGPVTAGSTATVTWTETIDRLSEFVTSSFTATTAGYYEVIAHAGASQTAGSACLIIKKNNASFAGNTSCNQGVTGLASILDVSITRVLNLSANDVIRLDASATTADATFEKMTMTIKRLP